MFVRCLTSTHLRLVQLRDPYASAARLDGIPSGLRSFPLLFVIDLPPMCRLSGEYRQSPATFPKMVVAPMLRKKRLNDKATGYC